MNTVPGRQHTVKRTATGDRFSRLVVDVFRLHAHLEAIGDALAAPAGQSTARWQVMAAADDAPRSVAEIARALGHARQSVQRVADTLVADGVAAWADNPRHRRARLLALTPSGVTALRTIEAAQRRWADEVGARVGAEELERLAHGVAVLMEALEGAG